MASEPSTSPDSYIGSLISLTTKFEIRYEGLVQNINIDDRSIGLINVKSYGTEGRKKDGQQIPPNEKVYEYILFRGSDIKDLSVKHVPVQPTHPIYSDPAIIQSHYSCPSSVSTSLPSASSAPVSNLNSQAPHVAASRPSLENRHPLYQPVVSSGPWASSASPGANNSYPAAVSLYQPGGSSGIWESSPSLNPNGIGSTSVSGLSTPPQYWQGFYGPSHMPQQSFSQPPLGLPPQQSMPQQTYSTSSAPMHSGALNLPTSNMSLQPSFSVGSANLTSTVAQSAEVSPSLGSNTASTVIPSTMAQTGPIFPIVGASISTNTETSPPPLVTPSQLLQPTLPPLFPSDPSTKDSQVVEASPSATQVPTQPLPLQHNQELHKPYQSYQNHSNRGRGRGRGNLISNSATTFTEEFDFMAMNEKFNKDEVWGDLGKSNDNSKQHDDDILASSLEKCAYKKDDFFDSISCQLPYNGQRNHGRNSGFNNGQAFGDIPRYRGGRGGQWPGHSRGSYHGRGYGYVGRGRGGY